MCICIHDEAAVDCRVVSPTADLEWYVSYSVRWNLLSIKRIQILAAQKVYAQPKLDKPSSTGAFCIRLSVLRIDARRILFVRKAFILKRNILNFLVSLKSDSANWMTKSMVWHIIIQNHCYLNVDRTSSCHVICPAINDHLPKWTTKKGSRRKNEYWENLLKNPQTES